MFVNALAKKVMVYLIETNSVFGRLGIHIGLSKNSENDKLGRFGGPTEPSASFAEILTWGDKNPESRQFLKVVKETAKTSALFRIRICLDSLFRFMPSLQFS